MEVKRIFRGGLAAAVVMLAGEFGAEPLVLPSTERFFSRLGLPLPGESAMVALAVIIVLTAMIAVCLYAALSEVSGRGVSTAAQTGVLVWTLSCLLPALTLYAYGVADAQFFWLASTLPLVQTVVGTVIGGLVYDGRKRAGIPLPNS